MVLRLGGEDHGTSHTKKLLAINSYAQSLGYSPDQLPFKDVPAPVKPAEREFMGFNYALAEYDQVDNPTCTICPPDPIIEDEDEDADGSEENPVEIIDGEDIEVLVEEEPDISEVNAEVDNELRLMNAAESAASHDRQHATLIRAELSRLLPHHDRNDNTLEVFKRLSSWRPWFPFRSPDSTTEESDEDRAELALFDEWLPRYNVDVNTGPHSFQAFARAWNEESARRFKAFSQGDDSIVQVRPKTRELLVRHYKKCREVAALNATAPRNDDRRQEMDQQLRDNRDHLPAPPPAMPMNPPTFATMNPNPQFPFGHPNALNAAIAYNTLAAANQMMGYATGNSPFVFHHPPQQQKEKPSRRGAFKSRQFCIVCGWLKVAHTREEGKGGRKRNGTENCFRTFCGKCMKLREHHPNGKMGPDCPFATSEHCKRNVESWYP